MSVTPQGGQRTLAALRQLERELIEIDRLQRAEALERAREAVARIGELGTPEAILERAAEELGASSPFAIVLVSEVRAATLVPRSLWLRERDAPETAELLTRVARAQIRVEYPLAEAEVGRGGPALRVSPGVRGHRPEQTLGELLGWSAYVVGALRLEGRPVGLLHCSAVDPGEDLSEELTAVYADGLARAFERAALRRILQRHRDELHTAVQWMSGRLAQLAADQARPDSSVRSPLLGGDLDSLTRREREVIELLARGRTNSQIAQTLVISEGTAKYHVKNVLRKLGATSRAEAVARYLQA
jgi:DNA-binding CsgD family transcriptional regulator